MRKRNTRQVSRKLTSAARPRIAGGGKQDWSRIRLACVAVLFGLVWAALWGRAWYVQVYTGPMLADKAERQHKATELIAGKRGEISDRNGRLLARSVEQKSVFVRPVEIENAEAVAITLAPILHMPPKALARRIRGKRKFVWLARKVGDKAAHAIRDAGIAGVYLTTEYGRQYPNSQLAGKLLGFVGIDDKGLEGVELAFDSYLTGQSSRQVVQRDAAGRRLYLYGSERDASLEGRDITLTIDSQIQFFAEEALAEAVASFGASWGGAVVVDVASGDIMAWAEYPSFNPNAYRGYSPAQWRNRIATDALEPGSILKPFLIAAALEEGTANPDSLYFCENGKWRLHGVKIRDTHKSDWLPVSKVLRYSSNIGVAKIGLELGATKYREYLVRLGFGQRTGVPVHGESGGILRPANLWREVDLANAAFGQGLAVTPLQVAQAYLCLANGGVKKTLRLIKKKDVEGTEVRVFSEKTAENVLTMLRDVVEKDGTGTSARIPGMVVGGKTGTAQKASPEGGYGGEYMASFVGVVPANKPRFVTVVMVDEPQSNHYGSTVAAPVFRNIAMRSLAYLGELPEYSPEELSVVSAGTGKGGPTEVRRGVNSVMLAEETHIPDVCGKSLRKALETYARKGIIPVISGQGLIVTRQVPPAGTTWKNAGENRRHTLFVSEQS